MRAFLTVILLAFLAYMAGFAVFAARLPVAPASPPPADGIVVLTGGDERLETAVALFEKGVGRRLLITGVDMATPKRVLGRMAHGGPRFSCCADIGYAAQDTHGNAEEAADWVRANHFRTLVLVTARYHMPRALLEFGGMLPGVELIAWPVEPDGIDLTRWWRSPRTALLLQREYAKYLATLVMTRV